MPTNTDPNIPRHTGLDDIGTLIKEDRLYSDMELALLIYKNKPITKWRLNAVRQLGLRKKMKGRKNPDGSWSFAGRAIKDYYLCK